MNNKITYALIGAGLTAFWMLVLWAIRTLAQ